jgi:hypothetical protein
MGFLDYDVDSCEIVRSISARVTRRPRPSAARATGHFPTEQAALSASTPSTDVGQTLPKLRRLRTSARRWLAGSLVA